MIAEDPEVKLVRRKISFVEYGSKAVGFVVSGCSITCAIVTRCWLCDNTFLFAIVVCQR